MSAPLDILDAPVDDASVLYRALLSRLARQGDRNAYAGVTLANEAGIALHQRMGFASIGVFLRLGDKPGNRHVVAWRQRAFVGARDE